MARKMTPEEFMNAAIAGYAYILQADNSKWFRLHPEDVPERVQIVDPEPENDAYDDYLWQTGQLW